LRFAIFCKSFAPDIERFEQLLTSIERHNASQCPFVVSVPQSDKALFLNRFGASRFQLFTDEDVIAGRKQNWRTQQLVKLYAWRLNFADAWMWVDSDAYFIRAFSVQDFVRDQSVAFVTSPTLHEWREPGSSVDKYLGDVSSLPTLSAEQLRDQRASELPRKIPFVTRVLDAIKKPRVNDTEFRIQRFFGRRGPHLYYMAGTIWTQDSLRSLERDFLEPNQLRYEDLIQHAPWEAIWLGEWEIYRGLPNRHVIQMPILHLSSDDSVRRARATGVTEGRVAQRYCGIQLAARHGELARLDA